MKVLVTGAAGFIGSHLVDRLVADQVHVTGLDDLSVGSLTQLEVARRGRGLGFHRFDVTSADLSTLLARDAPDVLVHLAATGTVADVLGTANVLAACVQAGVPRVVYASSAQAYGPLARRPLTERASLHPASPALAAKAAGELYVSAYQVLAGCSLRLGTVYGPRSRGVVSAFAGSLVKAQPTTIFGDGSHTRDLIYIDDVIEALLCCLDGAGDGRRLNIGSGVGTSIRALHSHLATLIGTVDVPDFAPELPGEVGAVVLDVAAARRTLGWQPHVGLEQGLAQTVDWVRGLRAH